MKPKLYVYDIGETKRQTTFGNFKGIGNVGQFFIQSYFRSKVELSGKKFYPMWTASGKDVYDNYFIREHINLDEYDLVLLLPEDFKYEKYHYSWYSDENILAVKTYYKLNDAFCQRCELIRNNLGNPVISYQIRETDKVDESNPPMAPVFYHDHFEKNNLDKNNVFVCSDSDYTLNILKNTFSNVVCLNTIRSNNFLPLHLFTHLEDNIRQQTTELQMIDSLMQEIYMLSQCNIVYYGLWSGILGFIKILNSNLQVRHLNEDLQFSEREQKIVNFYGNYIEKIWKHFINNSWIWKN